MARDIITNLNEITAGGTYIISSEITLALNFTMPDNVTLVFTPLGMITCSAPNIKLLGNHTTIIADPIPIFGRDLLVRGAGAQAGWQAEFAYPEWFEKADDLEDHDDSIEINKAASMNKYELTAIVNSLNYSSAGTIYHYIHERCYFSALTVKLLDKVYKIKHPIIIYSGGGLVGSKTAGLSRPAYSNIVCQPDGDWNIKRIFLFNSYWQDPTKPVLERFPISVKRAAILFTSDIYVAESTTGQRYCENITLHTQGAKCNGIIAERIQDGSYFNKIYIRGVHPFYSGLRIEPAFFEGDFLFDTDFNPIPKTDSIYDYWKGKSLFAKNKADSEGITMQCIDVVRADIAPYSDPITTFQYQSGSTTKTEPIYGAFPTTEDLETLLPNSTLTEYEVFTPTGGNVGSCRLTACQEVSIVHCGFLTTGLSVYNMLTGVVLELRNCSNLHLTNGGFGFSRIGMLISNFSAMSSGITVTDGLEEGITGFIVACKPSMNSNNTPYGISHCRISGIAHTSSGYQLEHPAYYFTPGYYNTIIDPRWSVTRYLTKDNNNQYHLIVGGLQSRTKTSTAFPDPFTWMPAITDEAKAALLAAKNANPGEMRYQLAYESVCGDPTPEFETGVPKASLSIGVGDGIIQESDLVQVSTLVDAVMSNYVAKSEINNYLPNTSTYATVGFVITQINELISGTASNYVTRNDLEQLLQDFRTNYPEYEITIEGTMLKLLKDNMVVSSIRLPFVKKTEPKVIRQTGQEC